MINSLSRYNQGTQVRMQDADGVYQLAVIRSVPTQTFGMGIYVWMAGDRPDLVAARLLGDAYLWWMIFDANPEYIDPFNIPVGAVLRIPAVVPVAQGSLVQ